MATTMRTGEVHEFQQRAAAAVLPYWDPFGILRNLMGWWDPLRAMRAAAPAQPFVPAFEVRDTEEAYILQAGRAFKLPDDAELDHSKAEFRDGVLRVEIPKRADAQSQPAAPAGAAGAGDRVQEDQAAGRQRQASSGEEPTDGEKQSKRTAARAAKGLRSARAGRLVEAESRPRRKRKHARRNARPSSRR